jgi:hypothetical protein
MCSDILVLVMIITDIGDCRGRYRIVVEFTTKSAIRLSPLTL